MLGKTLGKWEKPGKNMEKPGENGKEREKCGKMKGKNDGGSMIYEEIVNGFEIEKG